DAGDEAGAEAVDLLVRLEDERDDIGAAGLEAQRRPVGQIADLGGDLLHPVTGLLRQLGRSVEGAGNGGDGQARHLRDGLEGGFSRWLDAPLAARCGRRSLL